MVATPPPRRTSSPFAACVACRRASAGAALRKWNVVSDTVNDGRLTAAGVDAVHPACGGAGPRKQVCGIGAVPEGVLQALTDTGAEPVSRHVEALHPQQLRHSCSFPGPS